MRSAIKSLFWNRITKWIVRLRTYVVNIVLLVAIVLPEIVNSPEIRAVIPEKYQIYVLAFAALVNIWMRPRPAVLPSDWEAQAKKAPR